jgi:hypothetical protein
MLFVRVTTYASVCIVKATRSCMMLLPTATALFKLTSRYNPYYALCLVTALLSLSIGSY